ncbi:MAG: hypothetical protein HW391_368 [Chloroflexi bacterium]|nr:hypothetical protein [Chloroflexota bacterium]
MTNPLPTRKPRSRRFLKLVSLSVVAAVVLATTAPTASAASIRRVWQARLAAGGASGTAALTAYWTGNGALGLTLIGLQASATYPVVVYRGTCAAPIVLARLPAAVADAAGAVTSTAAVSGVVMNSVWSFARTGAIAIKVGTGSLAMCAALTFPLATRIAITGLKIDLPIIRQTTSYPPCNVAMYIRELSQPGEAGVTLIYGHARKGMFLTLLERSKINNGASLVGLTVQVWTSNNLVTTYTISKVRRHVTSLDGVFGIETGQLWIQTSEGPRGTVAKLIVVAKRTGVEQASHEAAHPTPRPVACS